MSSFIQRKGYAEWVRALSAPEQAKKRALLACFESQRETLKSFPIDAERFREAPPYDFGKPPHSGTLHYECNWGMTGARFRELARRAQQELGLSCKPGLGTEDTSFRRKPESSATIEEPLGPGFRRDDETVLVILQCSIRSSAKNLFFAQTRSLLRACPELVEGMTARLTILQVAYPLAPAAPDAAGGAEQVLAQLDQASVAAGHHSSVIACAGSCARGELIETTVPSGELNDAARLPSEVSEKRSNTLSRDFPSG